MYFMQERTLFFFSISDAETNFYEFWSPFPFPLPRKKHTCTQWGLSCTFLPLPQTDWPVNTFLNPLSICTGHSHDTCSFARTRACLYRMGPKPHCSPRFPPAGSLSHVQDIVCPIPQLSPHLILAILSLTTGFRLSASILEVGTLALLCLASGFY